MSRGLHGASDCRRQLRVGVARVVCGRAEGQEDAEVAVMEKAVESRRPLLPPNFQRVPPLLLEAAGMRAPALRCSTTRGGAWIVVTPVSKAHACARSSRPPLPDPPPPHHALPRPAMNTRATIDDSPPPPALSVAYNSDASCFSVALETGFRVYNAPTCEPLKVRDLGQGLGCVEMLGKTNYLALVGGGRTPKFAQNKVSTHPDRPPLELTIWSL